MSLADIGIIVAIILSIFGAVFGAFNYFKKPQEDVEKKAQILESQLQWERESNNRRFAEVSKSLDDMVKLNYNHTHTLDVKMDNISTTVNQLNLSMSCEISKLSTIINERIPK